MKKQIKNNILNIGLLCALLFISGPSAMAQQWYKGELHCHTIWSDGRVLPEIQVAYYKDAGYDFLCLTDHNVMQLPELRFSSWAYDAKCPDEKAFENETSYWKEITRDVWSHLAPEFIERAADRFGKESITTKQVGDSVWCRLKTFEELAKQFNEPNRFLLISGFEQTESQTGVGHVHLNFLNVPAPIPSCARATARETIQTNLQEGTKAYGGEPGKNWLFTVNHPLWQYYNVQPSDLIALPQVRFVELANNGSDYSIADEGWTPEKFWDVVNAFRCEKGEPLLFADGSSDNHFDDEDMFLDARAWTYVWAEELTPESLFTAMTRGDCYVSNGVEFEKINFNRETATLSVAVKGEPENRYRIDFFGTRQGFDQTKNIFHSPAGLHESSPERDIEVWSDEIGVLLKSVEGTEAEYQMADDLLYVRARVVVLDSEGNPKKNLNPNRNSGAQRNITLRPAAWTQPFSLRSR